MTSRFKTVKVLGDGLKDVYIPTLWYFEYLTFLDHKETLNRSGVDTLGMCGDDEVIMFLYMYLVYIYYSNFFRYYLLVISNYLL